MNCIKEEYYKKAEAGELDLVNIGGTLEKIVQKLVSQMEYDQMAGEVKRQFRGRAVGGGTTIGSALMGMAAAGVANATYGGLYEMKNILSNAKAATRRRDNFMKALLDDNFKDGLIEAVKHDIIVLSDVLMETFSLTLDGILQQYDVLPDYEKVQKTFFDDIGKYGKEEDYKIEDLQDDFVYYLTEFPTESYVYKSILEQFGDADRELDILAEVGRVDLNEIRRNIFVKRKESIPSPLYGTEYAQRVEECAKTLGYKVEIGEYVEKRNTQILERACSGNCETIEGLERNIRNLQEIDLPEADKKIKEFEKKIAYIKERDNVEKYLLNVNVNSITSLISAYKNIKTINTNEAGIKAIELVQQITELSLTRKVFDSKLFFADVIDAGLTEKISTEKKKIEDIFRGIQDCRDRDQYDSAMKKLQSMDSSVYDIQENIKMLWNNKMEIDRVLAPRNEKKLELEKEMLSLDEQIGSKQREYDESDAISNNALIGFFVNKQRQENLDRIFREKEELKERYDEVKNEYEINVNSEEIKKFLQDRLQDMKLPQPIFQYKETEKVIPFSMPKVLYYDKEKLCMLEITENTSPAIKAKYIYKATYIMEQYGKLIACDGNDFYYIVYKTRDDIDRKIKNLFGMKCYQENIYFLFEGVGKEYYEEEMRKQEEKKKQEQERFMKLKQEQEKRAKAAREIFVVSGNVLILRADGKVHVDRKVYAVGIDKEEKEEVESWDSIKSISAGNIVYVGLKSDGTVVTAGSLKRVMSGWNNMKMVCTSDRYSLGLQQDGTVKMAANGGVICHGTDYWSDIIKIYAGRRFVYGIDSHGKVKIAGPSSIEQGVGHYSSVAQWNNIVDVVEINESVIIGLRNDGSLSVAVGAKVKYLSLAKKLRSWRNIKKIVNSWHHVMALLQDGRVVVSGNEMWEKETENWSDIIDIAIDGGHYVGLKSDGTVVIASVPGRERTSHVEWKNVKKIATGAQRTIGLLEDGTILEDVDESLKQ